MFGLGDVFLRLVLGNPGDLQRQVQKEAESAGDAGGKTLGQRIRQNLSTGFGALTGGLIVAATEQASKFEDQLRTINTVAKLSDSALQTVGNGIKGVSAETGKTLDDLTSGFYDLVSAGVPASQALDVLRNSAILSVGTLGSTTEAVDVVTSAMGAFGIKAEQSARITDIFAQAVADGKTTLAGLAQGFSRVAPIAAAAGISLEEVEAATAAMTLKGASASQAYTDITGAINALLTPNAALLELQKQTGIVFADVAKQKGLAVALDEIRKATNGDNQEFAKILGSSEALAFAFSVTGENAGAFAEELGRVQGAADNGGVALGQYNEKSKSAIEIGKRLVAQVQNFLVTMGGPFVSTIGPAVFALNQLGQAFGLDRIAAKAAGAIIGGFAGRIIKPLIGQITAAFAAAELGTRLETLGIRAQTLWIKGLTKLDVVTQAFSRMWERITNSAAVQGAVGAAGAIAARVYAVAAGAVNTLTGALTSVWQATIGRVVVAAGLSGTAAGTAFAAAAAAAALAAPVIVFLAAIKFLNDIGPMSGANSNEAILARKAAREQAEAAAKAQVAAANATADNAAANKAWQDSGIAFAERMAQGFAAKAPAAIQQSVDSSFGPQTVPTEKMMALGRRLAGSFADSLHEQRATFDQAWDTFLDALKNVEKPSVRLAKLLGRLTSKELARGLTDGRTEVRARAHEVLQTTLDEIGGLVRNGHNIGKAGMDALRLGMKSKNAEIRAEATRIYNAIQNPLPKQGDGYSWGSSIGKGIYEGLKAYYFKIGQIAGSIANAIASYLFTHSPAERGPLSMAGGPEGWGRNIGAGLARGVQSAVEMMAQAASGLAAAALPQVAVPAGRAIGFSAPRAPYVGMATASGIRHEVSRTGDTYNFDVKLEGAPKAMDPVGVARQLSRFSQTGALTVRRT